MGHVFGTGVAASRVWSRGSTQLRVQQIGLHDAKAPNSYLHILFRTGFAVPLAAPSQVMDAPGGGAFPGTKRGRGPVSAAPRALLQVLLPQQTVRQCAPSQQAQAEQLPPQGAQQMRRATALQAAADGQQAGPGAPALSGTWAAASLGAAPVVGLAAGGAGAPAQQTHKPDDLLAE